MFFFNKTKKPQVQVLVAMDDIHKLTMLGYFKNCLQRIKIVLRQYFFVVIKTDLSQQKP